MFEGVDADNGASFSKLRVGEQRKHAAEVAEHVGGVVAGDPGGEIETVGHLFAIVARGGEQYRPRRRAGKTNPRLTSDEMHFAV